MSSGREVGNDAWYIIMERSQSLNAERAATLAVAESNHCTTQHPPLPPPCDAYGSSFFATGPHTDGTCTDVKRKGEAAA